MVITSYFLEIRYQESYEISIIQEMRHNVMLYFLTLKHQVLFSSILSRFI